VKITRVDVFQFQYSIVGGSFSMSGGKRAESQDSTLVKIATDEGIVGWGEQCAFSPNYIAAHGAGARAAIHLLAPGLIGLDPRQTEIVYQRMNDTLMGHPYAKSALDMACWDILGQAAGLPISELLGGTFQPEFPLYCGVELSSPQAMKETCARLFAEGYRRYQLKVGGDWREDVQRVESALESLGGADVVIVDANTYWRQHEATQVVAALDSHPIYMEQPCRTIAECAAVRKRSHRPFILDESLSDIDDIVVARAAEALDAAMLKLSRFGGITKIRQARDLCRHWGLAMTMEDSGGGDVVSAAMAHLSASTPRGALMNGFLINVNVNERIAEGAPVPVNGTATVPTGPGLGIRVNEELLGPPVFSIT